LGHLGYGEVGDAEKLGETKIEAGVEEAAWLLIQAKSGSFFLLLKWSPKPMVSLKPPHFAIHDEEADSPTRLVLEERQERC
jgi:hypothetical protein